MALTKEQVEAAHAWANKYIKDKNAELHLKLADSTIGVMPLKQSAEDQIVYNPIVIDGKKLIEGNNSMKDKSNYCCDYYKNLDAQWLS